MANLQLNLNIHKVTIIGGGGGGETSGKTISGPFDALIDGGIAFDASSVTTWKHSHLLTLPRNSTEFCDLIFSNLHNFLFQDIVWEIPRDSPNVCRLNRTVNRSKVGDDQVSING